MHVRTAPQAIRSAAPPGLAHLDRWYAAQSVGSASSRRVTTRTESWRRFCVAGATTTAVVAALFVLHSQGVVVSLDGLSSRVGIGPAVAADGIGSYRFMMHQRGRPDVPVTYDPCDPIRVVVNKQQAPMSGDQVLDSALGRVSDATGLTFVRDGLSDEVPGRKGSVARTLDGAGPTVLVAWLSPDEVPGLAGDVVGLGGSTPISDPVTGRLTYVSGQVSLDAPTMRDILTRTDGLLQARAIVMHELGHVVGLDHVEDHSEVMSAHGHGRTDWGPGDLTGLEALGKGRCTG